MSRAIRVEVVAPVHNRKAITLQCLKSLSRLEQDGLQIGVIIVDDGSTDGTGESIRTQFPNVELIDGDGNLWFTEGTNVGIRRALDKDPDYLLLINDDQVFDASSVRFMVETAERHPRSVVGPLLLLWDVPHRIFQTSPLWDTFHGGWRHWQSQTVWTVPNKAWRVDLIVGNCVLVPASAFREAGLMDSKRYPNFGDAEFTPRLKKRGWELLIDPRAHVFCQPNNLLPPMRRMKIKDMYRSLIVDLKDTHNLRRRLYENMDGAPSKLVGVTAFGALLVRIVFRLFNKKEHDALEHEPPLASTFADAVVEDS